MPRLHLKIMIFVNLDESSSSKTRTFGYDQQICPGIFWKAREDKIEEAKKQKTPKNEDQEWNSGRCKSSSWTWTTSSSSAWREWSSDKTRERSDWQSPAGWSSSDQTRERTDWELADWDSSDEARRATAWQSPVSSTRTFTRASKTTKITSVCDVRPSFRHSCHLSFVLM